VICDDQPEMREVLRLAPEGDGRRVGGETGLATGAITLCQSSKPDVLVLDLMLAGMSGLQAIPFIKAESPDTKIVVCSAYARHRSAARSLAVEAVVAKSGLDELRQVLKEIAGS
jgi:CheY-like chemotaxis protein